MLPVHLLCAAMWAVALLAPSPAVALIFEELPSDADVLFVRNCGLFAHDYKRVRHDGRRGCESWEGQFTGRDGGYQGDDVVLRRRLEARQRTGIPYREIWLFSGGGDSDQGFKVGRVLRQFQATVRVPGRKRLSQPAYCASACTVAFLGGLFRYIDTAEGATYQVHAASAWGDGFACDENQPECRAKQMLARLRNDPERTFAAFARAQQVLMRYSARRRLRHFQNTLLSLVGERLPEGDSSDEEFFSWAERAAPPLRYSRERLLHDVERFRNEGSTAGQDILMRIERNAMADAIDDLKAGVGQFGRRAAPALRMIEVMFQTSILETATLSDETLIRLGFVTKEFNPEA